MSAPRHFGVGRAGGRAVLDLSALPGEAFGTRSVTWWGTLAFVAIEGVTLAVIATSYLYLRKNFPEWPPPGHPLPDLLVPTVNAVLLLAVILPMRQVASAAKARDRRGVMVGLAAATALSAVCAALRWWEFDALNVRWDDSAYGSVAWALLFFHTLLLAIDVLETGAMAVLFHRGPVLQRHYVDADDAAFYQYFLSLVYLPVYLLLFLSPRWL